ncbi:MAG: shikimate dehydrogenase [Bacillota bacterium]|nr:shikimate dehydrogenase [Bacillota bacterium]
MHKHFAVLGYPIGHSLSPALHNEIFDMKGLDCSYEALLMPSENLAEEFFMLSKKYAGFNLTIPLKEKVIPLLDKIDPFAKTLGSVNTVKCTENGTIGYSTDMAGFMRSMDANGINLTKKKVLIIGGGGVARVIAFACAENLCDITIALRNTSKSAPLLKEIKTRFGINAAVVPIDDISGSFDLLLQCTPVGMFPHPDFCPVSDKVIGNCKVVFDTIYNPFETLIIKKAAQLGVKTVNGLEMLVYQGLVSQEIWLGLEFSKAETDHLIALLSKKLISEARK